MKDTSIEWCDSSINFHMGCTKVSSECTNCYMYRLMKRFGKDPYIVNKTNWDTIKKNLAKWEPSRIFVDSMTDFWHKDISGQEIYEAFKIMKQYDKHTYLILTKRPERMYNYLVAHTNVSDDVEPNEIGKNIWFGVSCGLVSTKDRIKYLQNLPINNIKFVSFEPLLEELGLLDLRGIDWAIIGGESDPNPRPTDKIWIEGVISNCRYHGTKVFLKQLGGNKKCKCHCSWGCRLWNGETIDEFPDRNVISA